MPGYSNAIKQIASYLVVLLITFLLLELALIFLDPLLFKGFFQYDQEIGFRVRPHTNNSNEFGFNDIDRPLAKPDNTYRIIVLGDSFNWAGGISCNYIGLLGEKLKNETIDGKQIEVINVGYPATAPYEAFLILKRYGVQYDPDMVILGFFAGNDFEDPNKKMIVVNANFYRIDRRGEITLFGAPIIRRSRIAEIFSQHLKVTQGTDTTATPAQLDRPTGKCVDIEKSPSFTEEAFLKLSANKLNFMDSKNENYFQPWIDFTGDTIRSLNEYLEERQIIFKVAILPDELQIDGKLLDTTIEYGSQQRDDLDIERPQRVMRAILSDQGIDYIDLLPTFRSAFANKPEESLYLPRDTHWNNRGNRLAAESLYDWLSGNLLDSREGTIASVPTLARGDAAMLLERRL